MRRVVVAVAVVAAGAVAMLGRHPRADTGAGPAVVVVGGMLSPTGAASTPSSRPTGPAASTTSTSTSTMPVASSAQVAAAMALAYVDGPVSGRRARCRPYDTAALDAELGQPTWTGGGTGSSDAAPAAVSVGAPVLVDDTAAGRGYEITVNGVAGSKSASVYVVATPAGGWLARSVALS